MINSGSIYNTCRYIKYTCKEVPVEPVVGVARVGEGVVAAEVIRSLRVLKKKMYCNMLLKLNTSLYL